jgi:hypothetical protein
LGQKSAKNGPKSKIRILTPKSQKLARENAHFSAWVSIPPI